MLNCKHMIKADDLPKTIMTSVGPPVCPWCKIEKLEADLATFGKDTEATENRIIDAEFKAQELRVAATMAKTRLDDFADQANAGRVHYSARELKRKIGSAFIEFDAIK